MLIFRNLSGYADKFVNIKYISIWDSNLTTSLPMYFLGKDHKKIVDIAYGETTKDVIVASYPHNPVNEIPLIAEKRTQEIELLMAKLRKAHPGRYSFTINIETLELITREHFSCLFPLKNEETNLFVFRDLDDKSSDVPDIYACPKIGGNSPYVSGLDILARSSHFATSPIMYGTSLGKKLTWMLLNSDMNGKFISTIPHLDNMAFPSNSQTYVPERYDTSALAHVREKTRASKLIMKDDGKVEDISEDTARELLSYLGLDITQDPDDAKKLELQIQKNVLEKNSISFTDMVNLGISRTMRAIPLVHDLITVTVDYPGIAKKMWIFEDKIHYIPEQDGMDIAEFIGSGEEYFQVTTLDLAELRTRVMPLEDRRLVH